MNNNSKKNPVRPPIPPRLDWTIINKADLFIINLNDALKSSLTLSVDLEPEVAAHFSSGSRCVSLTFRHDDVTLKNDCYPPCTLR